MNISVVEPLGVPVARLEQLKQEFEQNGHRFTFYRDRDERPASLIERMHDADVVVVSNIPLSQATLEQCPRLKMLSVAFTGLDHIDLSYCQAHDIRVCNAAGYSTAAVSELAVALMVDLLRSVVPLDCVTRQGGTRGTTVGRELRGKTVGVVGTGAIGTAVIRLVTAYGCRVLAYNRTPHREVEQMGVPYVSLNDLLRQSDIVTLHVPLTPDTHHLLGSRELGLLRPTALLVNTARGNVVDIEALSHALRQGTLAGAAIDVYEQEPPLPSQHPLLGAPNCILLPHVGYATQEAFDIRADIVFDNVRRFVG